MKVSYNALTESRRDVVAVFVEDHALLCVKGVPDGPERSDGGVTAVAVLDVSLNNFQEGAHCGIAGCLLGYVRPR